MAFSDPFIEAATAILKTTYPALAEFTFTTECTWTPSDLRGPIVVDCLSIYGTVEISPTVALDYVIYEKDAKVLFRTITIKDDMTVPIGFAGYNSVDNWTGEADVNQKIAAVRQMVRQQYHEANIRPTSTTTMFFIESATPLLDWLVQEKGMERSDPSELGRHHAILYTEGMELLLDQGAMGAWHIRCLGRKKDELSDWVREFSHIYERA